MTEPLLQARKLQSLAGRYMYGKENSYTDIVCWKEIQQQLTEDISELMVVAGTYPEEEAEILLAVLMGYCVTTIRNVQYIDEVLERAEKVLPQLTDKVLKCHLMVFCYNEFPDEALVDEIHYLMQEVKAEGKGEEIRLVEDLLRNMIEV